MLKKVEAKTPRAAAVPKETMRKVNSLATALAYILEAFQTLGRQHAAEGRGYLTFGVFLTTVEAVFPGQCEDAQDNLARLMQNSFTQGYNAQSRKDGACLHAIQDKAKDIMQDAHEAQKQCYAANRAAKEAGT